MLVLECRCVGEGRGQIGPLNFLSRWHRCKNCPLPRCLLEGRRAFGKNAAHCQAKFSKLKSVPANQNVPLCTVLEKGLEFPNDSFQRIVLVPTAYYLVGPITIIRVCENSMQKMYCVKIWIQFLVSNPSAVTGFDETEH